MMLGPKLPIHLWFTFGKCLKNITRTYKNEKNRKVHKDYDENVGITNEIMLDCMLLKCIYISNLELFRSPILVI